jgi:hypothetical protein
MRMHLRRTDVAHELPVLRRMPAACATRVEERR